VRQSKSLSQLTLNEKLHLGKQAIESDGWITDSTRSDETQGVGRVVSWLVHAKRDDIGRCAVRGATGVTSVMRTPPSIAKLLTLSAGVAGTPPDSPGTL
jgi:hypothetical protein